MSNIRLIVTDLDGTLIGNTINFEIFEEFRDRLTTFRQKSNTVWVTCTGRSLKSTKQFLSPMAQLGIRPDYIVISHAFIYEYTRIGYLPHIGWNIRMMLHQAKNARDVRRTIDRWYKTISATSLGVVTVYKRRSRLRMRFRTEEAAESVEKMFEKDAGLHPYLRIVRNGMEVDVFQLPFTKGLAVSELAEHLIIDRGEILTIGDGYNDISMLDRSVAAFSGCPGNAEAEVQNVVHENKGHIARCKELKGVVEILDAYLCGNVNSDLPEGWIHEDPKGFGRSLDEASNTPHTDTFRRAVLFVMVAITVLLVVAWFEVIPFSGLVLKPFLWFVMKVAEGFGVFF